MFGYKSVASPTTLDDDVVVGLNYLYTDFIVVVSVGVETPSK